MDYHYQPDAAHRCKRDVLLCRLKSSDDPTWKRVRPRPARNNFLGAFVLCKGMALCLLCILFMSLLVLLSVMSDFFLPIKKNI